MNANERKWIKINKNEYKWIQMNTMNTNEYKWIQIITNEKKLQLIIDLYLFQVNFTLFNQQNGLHGIADGI